MSKGLKEVKKVCKKYNLPFMKDGDILLVGEVKVNKNNLTAAEIEDLLSSTPCTGAPMIVINRHEDNINLVFTNSVNEKFYTDDLTRNFWRYNKVTLKIVPYQVSSIFTMHGAYGDFSELYRTAEVAQEQLDKYKASNTFRTEDGVVMNKGDKFWWTVSKVFSCLYLDVLGPVTAKELSLKDSGVLLFSSAEAAKEWVEARKKPLFENTIGEKFYDKDAMVYWFNKETLKRLEIKVALWTQEVCNENNIESQIYKTEASRDKALEEYKDSLRPKYRAFKLEEASEYLGMKIVRKDTSTYLLINNVFNQDSLNQYFEHWVQLLDGSPVGKKI